MQLVGWSLLQLLAVLGAASAVTVALYLLKLRRRAVPVPFIALWESLLADRQSSRLFSRIIRSQVRPCTNCIASTKKPFSCPKF